MKLGAQSDAEDPTSGPGAGWTRCSHHMLRPLLCHAQLPWVTFLGTKAAYLALLPSEVSKDVSVVGHQLQRGILIQQLCFFQWAGRFLVIGRKFLTEGRGNFFWLMLSEVSVPATQAPLLSATP